MFELALSQATAATHRVVILRSLMRISRSSCPTSFCTAILASGSAFAGASVPIPRTARRGSANTTIGAWNVVRHRLLPCTSAMLIRTPAVATRKDSEALFGPGAH